MDPLTRLWAYGNWFPDTEYGLRAAKEHIDADAVDEDPRVYHAVVRTSAGNGETRPWATGEVVWAWCPSLILTDDEEEE